MKAEAPIAIGMRKAQVDDADEVVKLMNLSYNNSYPIGDYLNVEKVKEMIKNKENTWLVTIADGKIVGCVAGTSNKWNKTYETVAGVTHPDYRKIGIARTLYKTILEELFKRQEDCHFTFGFPRSLVIYNAMTKGLSTPLLLTGYDGGMHIVNKKREHHLMGIVKNPYKKIIRVVPKKSKFLSHRFIVDSILSKIEFENEVDEYPNNYLVGPDSKNYVELNGISMGYNYIPASLSAQITSLSTDSENSDKAMKIIVKNINEFIVNPPSAIEHISAFVLADKENLIREMLKTGFEIVSYVPAWHHQNNKRYDCVMLIKGMHEEEPVSNGTHEIIKNFKTNFTDLSRTIHNTEVIGG